MDGRSVILEAFNINKSYFRLNNTLRVLKGIDLRINEGEVVVALDGGALGIGKVRDAAGAKMDADKFARNADLQVGMKFGT